MTEQDYRRLRGVDLAGRDVVLLERQVVEGRIFAAGSRLTIEAKYRGFWVQSDRCAACGHGVRFHVTPAVIDLV